MIDAHEIETRELRAHASEPPAETAALHRVPVVERVAPELAVGVEVVRRYAGHRQRLAARVEREQLAVPPDLDAVAIDVERQVAEQVDAALVGVALQRGPLQLEQVLLEHAARETASRFAARHARSAAASPLAVGRRPLPPRRLVEARAQHLEQPVRQEPTAARAHEVARRRGAARRRERRERRVARVAIGAGSGRRRAADSKSARSLGVDEARIAGIGRAQAVRRAVRVRDAERQRLPDAEAAGREPIDEPPRVGAERAPRARAPAARSDGARRRPGARRALSFIPRRFRSDCGASSPTCRASRARRPGR